MDKTDYTDIHFNESVKDAVAESAGGIEPSAPAVDDTYSLIAYDEESSSALVFRGLGLYQPYVACYGYDATDGTWSQGRYFSDIGEAATEYDRLRGVEQPWCRVDWYREDVAQFLSENGAPATDGNIEDCIDQLRGGRTMREISTSDGWETMEAVIDLGLLPDQAERRRGAPALRI